MSLNPEKIRKKLKNSLTIRVFSSIDSTNNEAKRRAAEDVGCALYAADSQSAGRGRRGHSFFSPPTGLYMTLSLPVTEEGGKNQLLTCAAAVAVCRALKEIDGLSPTIKWVNDIYLNGKKIAGILAELVTDDANRPLRVIIGVGVNLTTAAFPAEFAALAGCAGDLDPSLLCAAIADQLMEASRRPGDPALMAEYKALNLCLGRQVGYSDSDGTHTATAVDIAPDGSLIVEENGKRKSLHSGEISIGIV